MYVKKRFEDTKSLIYKCRHHMKAMSEHLAKCEEDGGGDPCNLEDEQKLRESYAKAKDLATKIRRALGSMRSCVASACAGANPRTKLRVT